MNDESNSGSGAPDGVPQAAAPVPPVAPPPHTHVMAFTGSGSEYFRIWIVNVLLTIVTLGIYAAWAKVRTQQYLHRNTRLADGTFDYHAQPMALLRGNLVAAALAIAYGVLNHFMGGTGFAISLVLIVTVLPWLLYRSLRFRLANTSYRGLRFGFTGTLRKAYLVFAGWPILTACTIYLLTPFTHHAIKSYQHNHSRYGSTPFTFDAKIRSFYAIWALWFVLVFLTGLLPAMLTMISVVMSGELQAGQTNEVAGLKIVMAVAWMYAMMVLFQPLIAIRLRNLIWNHTRLGEHRIESKASVLKALWIRVSNLVLIVCTLGLFLPFARVRWVRFLAASTALVAMGSVEDFVAGQTSGQAGAVGDGVADMFGIDIAL